MNIFGFVWVKRLFFMMSSLLAFSSAWGQWGDSYNGFEPLESPSMPLVGNFSGLTLGYAGSFSLNSANVKIAPPNNFDWSSWNVGGIIGFGGSFLFPFLYMGIDGSWFWSPSLWFDLGPPTSTRSHIDIQSARAVVLKVGVNFGPFLIYGSGGWGGANISFITHSKNASEQQSDSTQDDSSSGDSTTAKPLRGVIGQPTMVDFVQGAVLRLGCDFKFSRSWSIGGLVDYAVYGGTPVVSEVTDAVQQAAVNLIKTPSPDSSLTSSNTNKTSYPSSMKFMIVARYSLF